MLLRILLPIVLASALGPVSSAAAVQPPREPDAVVDPYTEGSAALMQRAGYVGFGPFSIGGYHGTDEVDKLLGRGRMLWLETEHFKIGTDLPPYPMRGDSTQRKKIREELRALKRIFPRVDVGTNELDPWLRMHLLARRCETVYEDFLERLGRDDSDFPERGRAFALDDSWMGLGPYLGQHEKFVVLITAKAADFGRYSTQYMGATARWPLRYNMGWKRSLLFGTALEFEGGLHDDTALHAHVVYNLVQNFCDGYRHLCHETPVWFKSGLAQWYLRRVDPRYPNFDRPPEGRPDGRLGGDWDAIARGLALHEAATPLSEMATWRDYGSFRYHDYVVAWSRVEFLLAQGGDRGLAKYLFRMKAPLQGGRGTPDWSLVLEQQDRAVLEAWGFESLDALDAAWRTWVIRNKRK